MIRKNYVGLISSSQIEEYVGAKGNTLVDHKKREKYKKGIKGYKDIKRNVKIKVMFAHSIKGCRPL